MRNRFLLASTILVAACGSADTAKTDTARASVPAVQPTTVASGSAASVMRDTSAAVRLVEEYVRRDATGERLANSEWFNSVLSEVDEDAGYDSFTAIRSYRVEPAGMIGDTTRVRAQYSVVGTMRQVIEGDRTTGMGLTPHDTSEVVIFPVVRTSGGLKIVSPQIDQHVLAGEILSRKSLPPLDAATRTRLAAIRDAK
jgi:hypothetical protein